MSDEQGFYSDICRENAQLRDRLQALEAERDRYKAALVKVNEWYEGKHEYAVDFLEDIEEQVTEALQPAKEQ